MQPPLSITAPSIAVRRLCLGAALLVALCALGTACDRHSADEVPEGYGHGSAHQQNYKSHQLDSRVDSNHFSDTRGSNAEAGAEGASAEKTGGKPVPPANPMGIGR